MNYTYTCPECDTDIDITFNPGRPAPYCQNHDSPTFSDSGDPAELDDCPDNCPSCGHKLDLDEIIHEALDNMEDPELERADELRDRRIDEEATE